MKERERVKERKTERKRRERFKESEREGREKEGGKMIPPNPQNQT